MSLLERVVSGREGLPPRILIYGCQGIGKTTFASKCPSPIILMTEDGIGTIEVPRLHITSYDELLDALRDLAKEEHNFKTVAIDTLDALEPLIWKQVCKDYGENTIERVDGGFHKGYRIAAEVYWATVLRALNYLRIECGMAIVLLAHSQVEKYDNPDSEAYDRFNIRLHKWAAPEVSDWCDVIGYAAYKVVVRTTDAGFNKTKGKGMGVGDRALHLEERPAFIAKNRYQLPEKMHFSAPELFSKITPTPEKKEEVTHG